MTLSEFIRSLRDGGLSNKKFVVTITAAMQDGSMNAIISTNDNVTVASATLNSDGSPRSILMRSDADVGTYRTLSLRLGNIVKF